MLPFDLVVVDASTLVNTEEARQFATALYAFGSAEWELEYNKSLAPVKGAFELLTWFKKLNVEVFLLSDEPEKYADTFQRLWMTNLVSCGALPDSITELSESVGKRRVLSIGIDERKTDSRASSMAIEVVPDGHFALRPRIMTVLSIFLKSRSD